MIDVDTTVLGGSFKEGAVSSEEDAVFGSGLFEQVIVFGKGLVGGVVAQNAQPPREFAQHAVGDKFHDANILGESTGVKIKSVAGRTGGL